MVSWPSWWLTRLCRTASPFPVSRRCRLCTPSGRLRLAPSVAGRDDQNAWDLLVGRFNRLLWAIARSFRMDEGSAADAVQVTWLRLVENLDRIDNPEKLGGWLATTMRRECLGQLRWARRERP